MVVVLAGSGRIVWGLVALHVWPAVFGATVLVLAQLWRIDRFTRLWEHVNGHHPTPDPR